MPPSKNTTTNKGSRSSTSKTIATTKHEAIKSTYISNSSQGKFTVTTDKNGAIVVKLR